MKSFQKYFLGRGGGSGMGDGGWEVGGGWGCCLSQPVQKWESSDSQHRDQVYEDWCRLCIAIDAENRLIFFASFKNVTLLVLAKCPIKPRNLFIDGRKKTIVSCRNMEGDVERRVLSARPDWQIASITQTLATRQSKDIWVDKLSNRLITTVHTIFISEGRLTMSHLFEHENYRKRNC